MRFNKQIYVFFNLLNHIFAYHKYMFLVVKLYVIDHRVDGMFDRETRSPKMIFKWREAFECYSAIQRKQKDPGSSPETIPKVVQVQ